jgi:hypothetical protein
MLQDKMTNYEGFPLCSFLEPPVASSRLDENILKEDKLNNRRIEKIKLQ